MRALNGFAKTPQRRKAAPARRPQTGAALPNFSSLHRPPAARLFFLEVFASVFLLIAGWRCARPFKGKGVELPKTGANLMGFKTASAQFPPRHHAMNSGADPGFACGAWRQSVKARRGGAMKPAWRFRGAGRAGMGQAAAGRFAEGFMIRIGAGHVSRRPAIEGPAAFERVQGWPGAAGSSGSSFCCGSSRALMGCKSSSCSVPLACRSRRAPVSTA